MEIMITKRSFSTFILINYPQTRSISEAAQYKHAGFCYSYYCIRSQVQQSNPSFGVETHLRISNCTQKKLYICELW